MGTIVVGVDGSENSKAALRWAIDEAARRDASVEAVLCWQEPYIGGGFVPPVPVDLEILEKSYRGELDSFLDGTEGVVGTLVRAPAAHELVSRSIDAELLVVGSRGHGGFMGLLLGSVSLHAATHSACPVVIVPADPRET